MIHGSLTVNSIDISPEINALTISIRMCHWRHIQLQARKKNRKKKQDINIFYNQIPILIIYNMLTLHTLKTIPHSSCDPVKIIDSTT